MLLYFNNVGKLTTITPHGEIPRQCGNLHIYVLFDETEDKFMNKQLWLRFKRPTKSVFEPDMPMEKEMNLWEFEKLPGENIGSLVNGKKYRVFHLDLTDTSANQDTGNLDIVFTMYTTNSDGDKVVSTSVLGKTTIYVEETLGLEPHSGLGMTYSEYENLLNYVVNLQNAVTKNRVGFIRFGEYNLETGYIDVWYDEEIVKDINYNEENGIVTITW